MKMKKTRGFLGLFLILFLLFCTMVFLYGCNKKEVEDTSQVITDPIINTEKLKETITINIKKMELLKGETSFLTVSVVPEKYQDLVIWESSNEKIVTVDSSGRIDGVSEGNVTITAKVGEVSDKAEIKITDTDDLLTDKEKEVFSTSHNTNLDIIEKNLKSIEGTNILPYYIKVNRQLNCVTIYTFDTDMEYTVPIKSMVCSTGENSSTILGNFTINGKYRWLGLFGNSKGQYVSGFSGDFLFHSVPYWEKDSSTLKTDEYNLLGESASLGCVRLSAADAKWIYDNCENGTQVEIFDDSNTPGPLDKPESILIKENVTWDPTDTDEKNPFKNKYPTIKGVEDITVKKDSDFDLRKAVIAEDTCGNKITEKVQIIGSINTKKPGVYRLTYKVTDILNKTTTCERYITVV